MTVEQVQTNPNSFLLDEVRDRVERLDADTCEEWGGLWLDETCHVDPMDFETDYTETTLVRNPADALAAFDRYTEWFEFVLDEFEPQSDKCILLPCGANKPIGSSAIHRKKVQALKEAGFYPDADIVIISEPCTVVPHGMRLALPPVNYDFPPEFTAQDSCPHVFDVFTARIARFIDEMPYETYYPYLVAGHQRKFDAALEQADSNPRVVRIPGSSLGLESHKLSGDLFKSTDDIITKLEMVRALADENDPSRVAHHDSEVRAFYEERDEYQPVA